MVTGSKYKFDLYVDIIQIEFQLLSECCWTTSGTCILFRKKKANQLLNGLPTPWVSESIGGQEVLELVNPERSRSLF